MNMVLNMCIVLNLLSCAMNLWKLQQQRKQWVPAMQVNDIPGKGPQLVTVFNELPPVGTVFYVRRTEPMKKAL